MLFCSATSFCHLLPTLLCLQLLLQVVAM